MTIKKPLIRIVDDDSDVLKAMRKVLELEDYQVATYASGEDFLTEDSYSLPGCVILDLKMPGLNGLEVQHHLKVRGFNHPVIFLTAHGEVESAVFAMKEGAADFLQKPADPLRLLEVVALNIEKDLKGLTLGFEERKQKVALLTPREAQVIKKVLMGLSNKEIGESLGLSERTVENHRAAAYKKLAVSSADELKDFSYSI